MTSKHPNAGLLIRRGLYDNLHSFTELEQRISALAYSRVGTGRTPSAVPSSSNFPASHLRGSELGLIPRSYRAFSSPPLGRGAPQPPRCVGFGTTMSIAVFWTSPPQQKQFLI